MKSFCSLAGILALSLGGLSALSPQPQPVFAQQLVSSYSVEVSLEGQALWLASVRNVNVRQVRGLVSKALLASIPTSDDVHDVLKAELELAFPGAVSSSQPAARYKAVWCEEEMRFVTKCCTGPSLLIKIGSDTVRVDIPIGVEQVE